jgi:hypothetical protein
MEYVIIGNSLYLVNKEELLTKPIDVDKLTFDEMLDLVLAYNAVSVDPEHEKLESVLAAADMRLVHRMAATAGDLHHCADMRRAVGVLLLEIERRKRTGEGLALSPLDYSRKDLLS